MAETVAPNASPDTGGSPAPGSDSATMVVQPDFQDPTPGLEAENEAVYDAAIDALLSDTPEPVAVPQAPPAAPATPEAPAAPATQATPQAQQPTVTPATPAAPQPPGTPETPVAGTPTSFTDTQIQLMSRLHVEPTQVASWPPEQQTAFLTNAEKREADQTTAYKAVKDELDQLKGGGTAGNEAQDNSAGVQATPVAELRATVKQHVTELTETFGPEMEGLQKMSDASFAAIDAVQAELSEVRTALENSTQALGEMAVDRGMVDLAVQHPTLSTPDVRRQVEAQFMAKWQESPHRTAEGPLPQRIRLALDDAARAVLGTTTDNAAQVALKQQTTERLGQQPTPGSGRGQTIPLTEDDVYDQEFKRHLEGT